jgi:hypothetical protein
MIDSYSVGNGPNQISLQVTVGSTATCHTAVFKKSAAGIKTRIADSVPANNGSVNVNLGPPVSLSGSEITIQTMADLSALPAGIIANVKADPTTLPTYVAISYEIDGGADNYQKFNYSNTDVVISSDGSLAVVTKNINMTP